jgi:hypothetical protein
MQSKWCDRENTRRTCMIADPRLQDNVLRPCAINSNLGSSVRNSQSFVVINPVISSGLGVSVVSSVSSELAICFQFRQRYVSVSYFDRIHCPSRCLYRTLGLGTRSARGMVRDHLIVEFNHDYLFLGIKGIKRTRKSCDSSRSAKTSDSI